MSSPCVAAVSVASLEQVAFGYDPGRSVLEDFNARLSPGEFCALIGPNAAGKSTLLRLMLGQLTPWRGRVALAGQTVVAAGPATDAGTPALTPAQRAALVSFVPQRAGVSFAFTVTQVVAMGRHALAPDPAVIHRALADCDLTGLADRTYAHLSLGQQQRVLLARAIAQSAGGGKLMLLDEPASAMDLWHIHQTMRQLRMLTGSGLSVLVVLHDLNLAARYADTIWLLDKGRLAAAGPWNQVLTPEVLEPVYRVRLAPIAGLRHRRPMFDVDLPGTLDAEDGAPAAKP
jgi:iron complex transport system ATP-binding protein